MSDPIWPRCCGNCDAYQDSDSSCRKRPPTPRLRAAEAFWPIVPPETGWCRSYKLHGRFLSKQYPYPLLSADELPKDLLVFYKFEGEIPERALIKIGKNKQRYAERQAL